MKKILKLILGKRQYCLFFHTQYETGENHWFCPKCGLSFHINEVCCREYEIKDEKGSIRHTIGPP